MDQATFQRRSNVSLLDIVGVCLAGILILAGFLVVMPDRHASYNKQKCPNNLKGIGIAMILYSNDYRFFPHMTAKDLENSASDVSTIYRSLIVFKYLDNPEALKCPASDDVPAASSSITQTAPQDFRWEQGQAPGIGKAPLFDKAADPALSLNKNLSYTARRGLLDSRKARSDTALSADKALRSSDPKLKNSASVTGNHDDGINILFADGHVSFNPKTETVALQRCLDRLQFEGCDTILKSTVETQRLGSSKD